MLIGFTERSRTVSEAMTVPGFDIFHLLIEVATLRTDRREHPMIFRILGASSSAIVEPIGGVVDPLYDATFGTRVNIGGPIEEYFVLEALEDTIPPRTAFIRDDRRPENEDCFTVRIFPVDVPGRPELFLCNEDGIGATNYFCETDICIEDDDGKWLFRSNALIISFSEPFVVGFVETTYTVDESVGAVNVCVHLTEPMIDILDERVNVFVIDYASSVYIPPGAPLTSE